MIRASWRPPVFVLVACGTTALALLLLRAAEPAAPGEGPQFTDDGRLLRPANYREWIFLSSGLGMSYSATESRDSSPEFDNVFVTPPAYKFFMKNGTWPDKTMFILEVRSSESKASINKGGRFQTSVAAIEAEVKDEKRFATKWAFFGFGQGASTGRQIPASAACYSCHATKGAVDNTFVQFYPTLLEAARSKGTLNADAMKAESR